MLAATTSLRRTSMPHEALRFDLGADVVGILGVTSTPSGTVVPAVGIDASVPRVVAIPPSLLARKQVIRATFLVDGPRAEVSCIQAPLIDVAVREGGAAPEPDAHRFTTRVVSATAALSTVYLAMQAFQR